MSSSSNALRSTRASFKRPNDTTRRSASTTLNLKRTAPNSTNRRPMTSTSRHRKPASQLSTNKTAIVLDWNRTAQLQTPLPQRRDAVQGNVDLTHSAAILFLLKSTFTVSPKLSFSRSSYNSSISSRKRCPTVLSPAPPSLSAFTSIRNSSVFHQHLSTTLSLSLVLPFKGRASAESLERSFGQDF